MYRIAVIEDNPDLRVEIREIFGQSHRFEVEFESDSIERTLAFFRTRSAPHILLLDLRLPGISGIDGLPLLKRLMPNTEIVVHTILDDDDMIFQAICNGATGYLLKSTPIADLEKYMLSIIEDQGSALSPSIARRVINFFHSTSPGTHPDDEHLNGTEQTIVNLLVEGLSYAEVATKTGMSLDGVRYYVKRIYNKLHIRTRNQLARRFLRK